MSGRIEWVLAPLERAGVRYLVVGGVAVVLHGYLRTTLDLDLVVQLEQDNLERALTALQDLGFQPRVPVPLKAFADPQIRETWRREKNMTVFSLWHPHHPGFALDLFVQEPFDFDTAYDRALSVPIQDDVHVTVVALEDLVAMKRAAGRARDLEDIEALLELSSEEES
jgi:uncharacterized nucleotidyltransferase DUF6036